MQVANPVAPQVQRLHSIAVVEGLALDDLVIGEVQAIKTASDRGQRVVIESELGSSGQALVLQSQLLELRAVLETFKPPDHVSVEVELLEAGEVFKVFNLRDAVVVDVQASKPLEI